jgi:predicted secreted hydrolase
MLQPAAMDTTRYLTVILALVTWAHGCGGSESADRAAETQGSTCEAFTPPADAAVHLPADDAAHSEEMEWWYWTGHVQTEDGRWFGFEQVVFLAQQLGAWAQVAHAAITDVDDQSFHLTEAMDLGRPVNDTDGFTIDVDGLVASGGDGHDRVSATIDNYAFDLTLVSDKAPVFQYGTGYTDYPFGGNTYYYSRERMTATGTLEIGGTVLPVIGSAWFDHQWGEVVSAVQLGWDWFALQLDDSREVMLFTIRDGNGGTVVRGSLHEADCRVRDLVEGDFTVTATGDWTSPGTGCTYPAGWTLEVLDETLVVTPVLADQEVTSMVTPTYWEGAAVVSGAASGRAYVELNGYCP